MIPDNEREETTELHVRWLVHSIGGNHNVTVTFGEGGLASQCLVIAESAQQAPRIETCLETCYRSQETCPRNLDSVHSMLQLSS